MIRVLHVLDSMGPGGAQAFVMNMYRAADRDKIQFDFLLHREYDNSYDDEIKQLGGNIYYIPGRRAGMLKYKHSLTDFFKEHPEYSTIHMHISSLTDIEPLIAAKKAGIKYRIVHGHSSSAPGSKIHKYIHLVNKRKIGKIATHFCACSDKSAEWFYSNTPLLEKSKVIQNAIDVDLYRFSSETRAEYRKNMGLEDCVVIGHVGRFSKVKNHEFLIDVFKDYNSINSNSRLVLVGDGPEKGNVENKVKEYNLEDKVIFTGNRKDVPKLFQIMDVVMLPSFYEGLPLVIVEAQSALVPSVVSDSVTHTVALTDGVEFCSLESPVREWSQAISRALDKEKNPDWNDKVKKSGFDIKSVLQELLQIYLDI